MFMRLKYRKAFTELPSVAVALLIVLLVFFLMFASGNLFFEQIYYLKEEFGLFNDALTGVKAVKEVVHG